MSIGLCVPDGAEQALLASIPVLSYPGALLLVLPVSGHLLMQLRPVRVGLVTHPGGWFPRDAVPNMQPSPYAHLDCTGGYVMLCMSSAAGLVEDKAYPMTDGYEHRIGDSEGMFPYTGQDGVRYSAYVSMHKDTILPNMVTLSARVEGVFVVSSSAFHGKPGLTDSPRLLLCDGCSSALSPVPNAKFSRPLHRTRRIDGRCLSQPQRYPKL